MTYATGSIITKGNYNLFVTGSADGTYDTDVPNIGVIWGTGFGRFGYGQEPDFVAPVETGQVIRSQEWDNLDAVLSNILDHELGPGTYQGLPSNTINPGQLVVPINSFTSTIQQAYNNVGKSYANVDDAARVVSYTGYWGNTGATTLKLIQTVTFPTADAARYFFNAGGKLKLAFTNTPAMATVRNQRWARICAAAGTITIGYQNTTKTGGSVGRHTILQPNLGGFWAHAPGNPIKEHFRQYDPGTPGYDADYDYDSYLYGYDYPAGYYINNTDYLKVEATILNSDGLNGSPGAVVRITTTLVTGSVLTPAAADEISGTVTASMTISRPSTVYLPVATWAPYTYNQSASPV